jgi:hypothetical protein
LEQQNNVKSDVEPELQQELKVKRNAKLKEPREVALLEGT